MDDRNKNSFDNSPSGDGGIAVIADDFTGAAELAGISLRYGLNVKLYTGKLPERTDADVIVISTDSRSKNKEEALSITREIVNEVLAWKPKLIYKKIDSVLRGYVLDELGIQMKLMNKQKVFILPANPSLGRTISNGNYYLQGKLISETAFVNDPEFPIKSSSVRLILDNKAAVIRTADDFHENGFMVGESADQKDISQWASKVNQSFVLAGAGDFYTALLDQRFKKQEQSSFNIQLPFLYVCGTAFEQSVNYVREIDVRSGLVAYISKQIIETGIIDEVWLERIDKIIKENNKAVIAFDNEQVPSDKLAAALRKIMAMAVRSVMNSVAIGELLIEGGSTATAIFEELKADQFIPVNELSRGVVRMKSGSYYITVKPGSYALPPEIINLYS